jgi:Cytochrome bd terminal oxidase subunit I
MSLVPGPYIGTALAAAEPAQLLPAREQMAFTLAFHIVLVPFGVAFTFMMLVANYRGIRRGDSVALLLARRWSKVAAVLFAVGAVTGHDPPGASKFQHDGSFQRAALQPGVGPGLVGWWAWARRQRPRRMARPSRATSACSPQLRKLKKWTCASVGRGKRPCWISRHWTGVAVSSSLSQTAIPWRRPTARAATPPADTSRPGRR